MFSCRIPTPAFSFRCVKCCGESTHAETSQCYWWFCSTLSRLYDQLIPDCYLSASVMLMLQPACQCLHRKLHLTARFTLFTQSKYFISLLLIYEKNSNPRERWFLPTDRNQICLLLGQDNNIIISWIVLSHKTWNNWITGSSTVEIVS